jgi:tetratricopeptide (TPR) repeat protein
MRDYDDDYDFRRREFRRPTSSGISVSAVILIVIVVGSIFGAGIVGVAIVASLANRNAAAARKGPGATVAPPLTRLEERQDAADAFADVPHEVPPETMASVQVFFDSLVRALGTDSKAAMADTLDCDGMCDELLRLGCLDPMTARDRQSFVAGFKQGFLGKPGEPAVPVHWNHCEIRKVRPLRPDSSVVVVFLRVNIEQSVRSKQRWWLRKHDNSWQWFDMESLEEGIRISAIGAAAIPDGGKKAAWVSSMRQLRELIAQSKQQDWAAVEKSCVELERIAFPPMLRALVLSFHGAASLGLWKLDAAENQLTQAERIFPDQPAVYLLQATLRNHQGQSDPALRYARKYLDLLGDDATAYHEMAIAYQALNQRDLAIDAFRKGLADDPDDTQNLIGLCQAFLMDPDQKLTQTRKIELAQRMSLLSRPTEQVEQILPSFVYGKENAEILEVLLAGYRSRVPNSLSGDYYEVRLKILKDEFEPACKAFRNLIPRVADKEKNSAWVAGFLDAMVAAGKPVEGYQAAPEPKQAFRIVADELIENGSAPELRMLVQKHAEKCPDDVWLLYYSGEAHMMKEEYAAAEADFDKGLSQAALNDEEKASYRSEYLGASFEAGHGLKAYEAVTEKTAAFLQLAGHFASKPDSAGLAQLIEAHRKNQADDPYLPRYEAEVKWLDKDYAGVVDCLTGKRERILQEQNNRWMFADRLVRSLARLKRTDEALKEWRALQANSNPVLEAVIHALAGDVAQTETALARCVAKGSGTWAFHNDPDLGPILRSDPFQKLCQKYPDPRRK